MTMDKEKLLLAQYMEIAHERDDDRRPERIYTLQLHEPHPQAAGTRTYGIDVSDAAIREVRCAVTTAICRAHHGAIGDFRKEENPRHYRL